jgi:hypothetical protein
VTLDPVLFSSDARLVALLAGEAAPESQRVAGVVVDWEKQGKWDRQQEAETLIGTDTQIGLGTPAELAAVVAISPSRVSCRVDAWPHPGTCDEIDLAIHLGADEILLPMVRSAVEVEAALTRIGGRAGLGILVETRDAVEAAADLSSLPLTSVYVGLMDLAIDTRNPSIFAPMLDGTVERLRDLFSVRFGVAGLTVPWGGHPVPARLLAGELSRLDCDFSFLRRSFIRDAGQDPISALGEVRSMLERLAKRTEAEIESDRGAFVEAASAMLVRRSG